VKLTHGRLHTQTEVGTDAVIETREDAVARTELKLDLLYKVHIVLPLLMFLMLLWVSWRLVNIPTFADFLIATEAEMNKVSWSTRRRRLRAT